MVLAAMLAGLVLMGAALWWLLDRHEQRRVVNGKPRHSPLRLVFAAAALLVVLFAGGCSLLFLANMDGQYVTWEAVAGLGGVPLAVSLLAWWLAMRRNKV